ncbi:hypothetical protein DSO57_1035446 [Entomophthora muscae]|uniref:Uncharacterized protein n=1 Tax=Entomophthora muscae TaxID=34485 RepID=A0ACC2REC1_9FUNG|nr:hypothetical protein DSO57_1035446 [Entomophthora muscae]
MSGYNFTSKLQGLKAAMQENAGWAIGSKDMQEAGSAGRTKDGDEITSQAYGYYESVKTAFESGLSYAGRPFSSRSVPQETESDKPES